MANSRDTNIEKACSCRAEGLNLVVMIPDNDTPRISEGVSYLAM